MMPSMKSDVAVVVLAGGDGHRIGGNKPLTELGGERLIDRALRQASSWSGTLAVSVRDSLQIGGMELELVIDEPGVEGPVAGLISALKFAKTRHCEFVLTIAVDTPFLPADLHDRLLSAIGAQSCAIASSGGRLHPTSGLWRTSATEFVQQFASSGKRSLAGLAEALGCMKVEWPIAAIDPFFNINSPDDLRKAGTL